MATKLRNFFENITHLRKFTHYLINEKSKSSYYNQNLHIEKSVKAFFQVSV